MATNETPLVDWPPRAPRMQILRPDGPLSSDYVAPAPDDADAPNDADSGLRIDEEARAFPVVHVLEGDAPAPPSLLADGLLLDRDINLFAGNGGSGKSAVLFAIAVSVALGRPVFGTLHVRRPGPVLLVLPEDGESVARMMLDAFVEGIGLEADLRALLAQRLVMIRDDTVVRLTCDTARIGATAREHGAVLVALDPLSNLLAGASERDEDVATPIANAIRRNICWGAGASVLLTHHNRKPGKDVDADAPTTAADVRGSGGWVNSARLAFAISKRQGRVTMHDIKGNRLAQGSLRYDLELDVTADPENKARWLSYRITDANAGAASVSLTPGVGRQVNENERRALASLDDRHEPGRRVSWSEWTKTSGLKHDTLKSIKTRLLDARMIEALPAGQHRNGGKLYNYSISGTGRMALDTGWTADSKGEKNERVRGCDEG